MNNIESQIAQMYDEIDSYEGNFGDPIASEFSFKAISVLKSNEAEDDFIRLGAGIALLVDFSVIIDNYDYKYAVKSSGGENICIALQAGLLNKFPIIVKAMIAALNSENVFYETLKEVYIKHIKDWRHKQNA